MGQNQEAAQLLPKGCSRKMSPSFLNLNGAVCSNTLFSNTSALTSSLLFRGNSTYKILAHLVWSNTSGFQFWGPLARTNFLAALRGLPTARRHILMSRGKKIAARAARQFVSLKCFASTLAAGVCFRGIIDLKPSLRSEKHLRGLLRDDLCEVNCESRFAARQWGVDFCERHPAVSQRPLGSSHISILGAEADRPKESFEALYRDSLKSPKITLEEQISEQLLTKCLNIFRKQHCLLQETTGNKG